MRNFLFCNETIDVISNSVGFIEQGFDRFITVWNWKQYLIYIITFLNLNTLSVLLEHCDLANDFNK